VAATSTRAVVTARQRGALDRTVAAVCTIAVCLVVVACGGSSSESAGDSPAGGDGALATVEAIDPQVAVRRGDGAFTALQGSSELGQGDQVQTDASGFAQVVFFDGSWQRVEADTTLTLTELVDIEGGQTVRTGIDKGRAWQRVEALTDDEDAFAVDTPVAVASVRGTAFAVDCDGEPIACTYSVVEGIVEVAVSGGAVVPVTPGEVLRVPLDQPAGEPQNVGVDALRGDPWIAKNLALDASDPPTSPGGGSPGGTVTAASGPFYDAANSICEAAGEQNAEIGVSAAGDEAVREQAEVLDAAIAQLDALEPPPEVADEFDQMLAAYRRRTTLVAQALAAPAEERRALVTELLSATATGADHARGLGLLSCVVSPS
jgi:hypothetical protein